MARRSWSFFGRRKRRRSPWRSFRKSRSRGLTVRKSKGRNTSSGQNVFDRAKAAAGKRFKPGTREYNLAIEQLIHNKNF